MQDYENSLDCALNKFRDYAQGKGDYDELDFKEYLYDVWLKQQVEILIKISELPMIPKKDLEDVKQHISDYNYRLGHNRAVKEYMQSLLNNLNEEIKNE